MEERKDGYYWILFNWTRYVRERQPNWEPASWDERTKTWVMMGSRQEVPDDRRIILKVGPEIVRPPDLD